MTDTKKTTVTRGAPPPGDAEEDAGFAGLPQAQIDEPVGVPAHMAAKMAGARRVGRSFMLPSSVLPLTWRRPESDRRFAIIELSTNKEDHAAKLAGAGLNVSGAVKQMVLASVAAIGEKGRVTYDDVVQWYEEIGPRGRKLVDQGFHKVNSPQQADTESFLASEDIWEG